MLNPALCYEEHVATHVSIHDVSPALAAEMEDALAACAEVGAKPALLVVPDFHGDGRSLRYPNFVDRLRELQGARARDLPPRLLPQVRRRGGGG